MKNNDQALCGASKCLEPFWEEEVTHSRALRELGLLCIPPGQGGKKALQMYNVFAKTAYRNSFSV
jgi:hypothetical protein